MQSHAVGYLVPQLFKISIHPANPPESGSRPRKSMYCWRMKKDGSTIGLLPVDLSLSTIVTTAREVEPKNAPPIGLLNLNAKVSGPSAYESSTIGMKTVFALSPAEKRSVPTVFE